MLEDLSIKDFALIDNAHVDFSKGFTVLSGETGAGKSLLIGALTFLLGGKGGTEQIRTGAHEATVSGTFVLDDGIVPAEKKSAAISAGAANSVSGDDEPRSAAEWLSLHGISAEDNRILLRRYVRDTGKSGAWIGDTAVTRSDLASFSSFLVDIHGQHEHQSLMRVAEHRKFLDSYAEINDEVSSFTSLYTELVQKRAKLDALNTSDADRAQKIELLNFAVKEITDAKLKAHEDEDLEAEETKLASFEKLYSDIEQINGALESDEGEGAVPLVKKIRGAVQHSSELDKSLEQLSARMESAYFELNDIAAEYRTYSQSLAFDPDRLAAVQEREALIYQLKKKYASSVTAPLSEVIDYCAKAQQQLENLDSSAEGKAALQKEIAELEKRVYTAAKKISEERKSASEKMAAGIADVLSKLGMAGTRFSVSIIEKAGNEVEQKCGPYGMDDIQFLISANPGSPLLPLDKIASGGELSRVMLALKTVLAASDPVQTLVFDEIDTGIGGEIAVSVGSHLKNLAKNRQILCITHLASIAVYADNQIKIEKGVTDGMTQTHVFPISGDKRVTEIARMLSGDPAGAESLEHARAMLQKFGAPDGGN